MKAFQRHLFCAVLVLFAVGCSREREISGQIFIVTQSRDNVKMGLVGVHVLSDLELKTAALKMFQSQASASTLPLADRLFANLPPPVVKTDADGQFTVRAKEKVWLLARAERKVSGDDETYLWLLATEGQPAKLLLSNDNVLEDGQGLQAILETFPAVASALASEAKIASDKAAAETKALAEKRISWNGPAMRRVGFKEDQIQRTLIQGGKLVLWGGGYNWHEVPDGYGYVVPMPRNLDGVVSVAAGRDHTAVVMYDGTVKAWGSNIGGKCDVPVGLRNVVTIAACGGSTVALKQDGTVLAWGDIEDEHRAVPNGLSGMIAVATGYNHAVCLKIDGTIVTWGKNDKGQCNVPSGLNAVVSVACGYYHTIALMRDGTITAWGNNESGQCTSPEGFSGIVAIAAGEYHSVALKQDGTVVAWGKNDKGQTTVPLGLRSVISIAAAGNQAAALKQDGSVVTWGENYEGRNTPPSDLSGVVVIAAGNDHTVALKLD